MEFRRRIGIRNLVCGALALCLLGTRRARRARKQALSGGVITAIYFHNPGKNLFSDCISWLIRNGYKPISVDQLAEILHSKREFPKGAVWISLDDGYREWVPELLPVIREYNVPVTLFIPSGIVAGDGSFPWVAPRGKKKTRAALTLDELKEIAGLSQVQLGGHTVKHVLTPDCTKEELRAEIGGCKHALESWTGKPVCSFSYPVGHFDGREREALEEFKYSIAVTTQPRFVEKGTDPLLVPRFCVPDNVTLPEAICNMVGIWHPFLEPIKSLLHLGTPADWMPFSTVKSGALPASEQRPEKDAKREEETHVV